MEITIADDDGPTATLSVSDSRAAETSAEAGEFQIALTNLVSSSSDVALDYTLTGTAKGAAGTTAAAGDDYVISASGAAIAHTDAASGTLTVAAASISNGAATFTIIITPEDDAINDDDETVKISITAPSGIDVSGSPQTITIADDDELTATLSVSNPRAAETSAEAGEFQIALTNLASSSSDVVLGYTLTGTAIGATGATAAAGDDYVISASGAAIAHTDAASGTLTVAAASISNGAATFTIIITPEDDAIDDDDETVEISITAPRGIDVSGSPQTITIADDDGPTATLSVSDPSAAETSAEAGEFQIALTELASSSSDVVLGYTLTGTATGAAGTTAATGDDYVISASGAAIAHTDAASGTLTVAAASISSGAATFTIIITPVTTDNRIENPETVILSLTVPDGISYTENTTAANRTVTIADENYTDDILNIGFVSTQLRVNEPLSGTATGDFELRIALAGANDIILERPIAVNVRTEGGSARSDHDYIGINEGAGVDYTLDGSVDSPITITTASPGMITVTTTVRADTRVEPIQFYRLRLSPSETLTAVFPDEATVEIIDAPSTISVAVVTSVVAEGTSTTGDARDIRIGFTAPEGTILEREISVDLSTADNSPPSAIAGSDYTAISAGSPIESIEVILSSPLTFDSEPVFPPTAPTVTILTDSDMEGNETFLINLIAPFPNQFRAGGVATGHVVTITDDD